MAKQTFTTGQVLTAAEMTSLQQTAMGGGSTTAKTTSYVLVAADAGTVVQMNSSSATTITVNQNLFAAGDTVQIQNVGAGVCTVTAGTATVSTAGSLALSQYEGGQLYFNTTSAALFFDIVQSSGMTNPMTTTGDIIYSSSGSTPARLGIGTTGQVVTVASGVPSWATPASGGGMTLLSTTSLSGSITTISSISQSYQSLYVLVYGVTNTTGGSYRSMKINGTNSISYIQQSTTTTTVSSDYDIYLMQIATYSVFNDANNAFALTIDNYAQTTNYKTYALRGVYNGSGTPLAVMGGGGAITNGAVTSLTFNQAASYTFTAGTVKIYGVN